MEMAKNPKTPLLKKPYLSIKILEITNLPFDQNNKLNGYLALDDCYIQVDLDQEKRFLFFRCFYKIYTIYKFSFSFDSILPQNFRSCSIFFFFSFY
jgi:hypothetical protein